MRLFQKNIVSLQIVKKSSVFAMIVIFRNLRNFEYCIRKSKNTCRICEFAYSVQWVVLKTSKNR